MNQDQQPLYQRTPSEEEMERHFQARLSSGEYEPGDAIPFTDEELEGLDPDDEDDINPDNALAYEHLT